MIIPYARQDINNEDIDAVIAVLQSDFLTQGPMIPAFEQAIASYCQSKYALATNSATSALQLVYLAMDLGEGDWLWTSPNTFVATSNAALHCGANVDFVDIDKATYNLCPQALEQKLIQAELDGNLPKIVVPVHFAGQSCDMKRIYDLAQYYGFKIVEDASHALGGKYEQQMIGNCAFSEATVFSFHPVKIITSGEGGMIVSNDPQLMERISLLRSHGTTRDENLMTQASPGAWYYEQLALGFNYRMTDLQAALGLSQSNRLNDFIDKRHKLAARYNEGLGPLPLTLPFQAPQCYSAFHLYVIRLHLEQLASSRAEIFAALQQEGINVNVHYIPAHLQPYYQQLGFRAGMFPVAEQYYEEAISLPMYPKLNAEQQDKVIHILEKIVQ
ncbi:UDP-4-amino-4,6-dideoxy-N-acetyl-beta-L-altrosamine transaminase [Legionella sp. km772]|uniref:UDP-4-amino-4, 6-dideoxy-N-acetyl-beta-L-altrosamine transaminase n=1 Tax=Legionella sp. km772 TaxID=2498111 RepID=UPI000F8F1875|nr:UDP-4-amino-4,6-dideoxy-N-acetyl-beta-L-altrosamine transaminase [Legionella sp. km772]RUR08120.1 UDP-4-amino-4,6-dideoxy-N-acetyl-beta-L-altrosamine transaminase [Legionella sp. km772]